MAIYQGRRVEVATQSDKRLAPPGKMLINSKRSYVLRCLVYNFLNLLVFHAHLLRTQKKRMYWLRINARNSQITITTLLIIINVHPTVMLLYQNHLQFILIVDVLSPMLFDSYLHLMRFIINVGQVRDFKDHEGQVIKLLQYSNYFKL